MDNREAACWAVWSEYCSDEKMAEATDRLTVDSTAVEMVDKLACCVVVSMVARRVK